MPWYTTSAAIEPSAMPVNVRSPARQVKSAMPMMSGYGSRHLVQRLGEVDAVGQPDAHAEYTDGHCKGPPESPVGLYIP
jgi:hypothetical protein